MLVSKGSQAHRAPDPDFVLRGGRSDVQAILFHPHLDLLYSGDAQGELCIWDLQERRPVQTRRLHPGHAGILSLAWIGQQLLSQGRDGTIKSWQVNGAGEVAEGDPTMVLQTNSYNFCRCSVGPVEPVSSEQTNGKRPMSASRSVASAEPVESVRDGGSQIVLGFAGSDPADLEIWKIYDERADKWAQLRQAEGDRHGMCMALQLFHRPGTHDMHVAAGYEDGTVSIWRVEQPAQAVMSSRLHSEPVMDLKIDASCQRGASASADEKIVTFCIDWDLHQLRQTGALPLKSPGVAALAIRQDSKILAAAGWDSRVLVFHYVKHRPLAVLQYHRDGVLHVIFDARTKRLASASKDGTIALWSIYRDA